MANYNIVIEKRAEKELRKLARPIRQRLADAIDSLARDPLPAASKPLVGTAGYRLRVGGYRIIYDIDHRIITVYIIRIGHRRDIYYS